MESEAQMPATPSPQQARGCPHPPTQLAEGSKPQRLKGPAALALLLERDLGEGRRWEHAFGKPTVLPPTVPPTSPVPPLMAPTPLRWPRSTALHKTDPRSCPRCAGQCPSLRATP